MLPIYISYFAGGSRDRRRTLLNAIGFVFGFTLLFVLMGALAGTVGAFLKQYQTVVNIITGAVVIFFGLTLLGVFTLNIFKGISSPKKTTELGFFSSVVFGIIFSVGWTPCVGAFLGSALMMAGQEGSALSGIIMLLVYSLGLGIPFILSAILIDRLRSAFDLIKRNYRIINTVCGILLITVGVLMATGMMGRLLTFLS
jgi:cytochrome c-type biogenesis protein